MAKRRKVTKKKATRKTTIKRKATRIKVARKRGGVGAPIYRLTTTPLDKIVTPID